jgi:membrane dipeptidase
VRKLLGENVLRLWAQNEAVAVQLQKVVKVKPVEGVWGGRKWTRWDDQLPVMIPGNPNRIRVQHGL